MGEFDFAIDNMVWSYSRLNSFYDCPYSWLLNYIYGNKSENGFFGEYGGFCHEVLEKFAKGELSTFELSGYYEQHYKTNIVHDAPPNAYVDLGEKYFNVGKEYFDNFQGFNDYKILEVEKKVDFKIEGYKFTGFIDLLARNKQGQIEIIDHKSADIKPRSNRKKETKGDAKLDDYLRQLYMYSIPIYDEFGEYPARLNFNAFRVGNWISEDFKIEALKDTKKWVVETINNIKQETKWLPKGDEYFCLCICGMRRICDLKPRI